MSTPRQPALFIGHGSPMNALENNRHTRCWQRWAESLPQLPRAVVVISAHWLAQRCVVGSAQRPATIHDFSGFPAALSEFKYDCQGAPALAEQIIKQLGDAGIDCVGDSAYGLDHGAWAVLCQLFPAAQIPVLQIALDMTQPMQWHYQLARQLKHWRDDNILFVASGNIVHNIAKWQRGDSDMSAEYRLDDLVLSELQARSVNRDDSRLVDYQQLGEWVLEPIPYPDHYLPFVYSLGLSDFDEEVTHSIDSQCSQYEEPSRFMRSVKFG